jgi:uncharacterized membrane-anchored protein
MTKRKILITSIISTILLFIAVYFSFKSDQPDLNMINFAICILAGFSVTLIALWIAIRYGHIDKIRNYKLKSFLVTLLSVAIVAFLWGFVQKVNGNLSIEPLVSILGGLLAFFYFTKYKRQNSSLSHKDFYFPKTVKQ